MTEQRFSLPLPWPEVWTRLKQALSDNGLEMVQSFDLQSARSTLAEPDLCPCPHHGTINCSCQYMVWLVRWKASLPLSLVIHGHDDCTYITLSEPTDDRRDQVVRGLVQVVLERLAPVANPPSI